MIAPPLQPPGLANHINVPSAAARGEKKQSALGISGDGTGAKSEGPAEKSQRWLLLRRCFCQEGPKEKIQYWLFLPRRSA